jgi:cytochrome c oxidase cbb3-type subunit 3
LWGGDEATVYQTIANGRTGVMPAWGSVLGPAGVEEVAAYVLSLGGRQERAEKVAAGKERFAALCVGCHGVDGRGNPALGAPDLTDYIWLYGGDTETVRTTIALGRNNQMPAHAELLGDTKVRLLAAYVLQWSKPQVSTGVEQDTALTSSK